MIRKHGAEEPSKRLARVSEIDPPTGPGDLLVLAAGIAIRGSLVTRAPEADAGSLDCLSSRFAATNYRLSARTRAIKAGR